MARTSGLPRRITNDAARRAFSLRFFGDAAAELRRVTWPSREETMRLSVMVISVAAAVGLFLFIFDLVFTRLFDLLLGT